MLGQVEWIHLKTITLTFEGTTWMQELVWMVMYDCDYEKAKESLLIRSPFLE